MVPLLLIGTLVCFFSSALGWGQGIGWMKQEKEKKMDLLFVLPMSLALKPCGECHRQKLLEDNNFAARTSAARKLCYTSRGVAKGRHHLAHVGLLTGGGDFFGH